MSSYSLAIGGAVPVICWMRPADGGAYEIFCNSLRGFDVIATARDGGDRVVLSGTGPAHDTVILDLREEDTTLTVQAR